MAKHAVQAFLDDPDPADRRAELLAFVGPRPVGFLDLYDYLVAHREQDAVGRLGRGLLYNGFSAYAFFLGPVYFFYRKMWLWGTGYVLAMLTFAAIPATSRADIGLSIAMALVTRWVYVRHAIGKIESLRAGTPEAGEAFLGRLAEAGGVSWVAGWISGALFAFALVLAVMQSLGKI
jgi:hypothetical protein